GSSELEALADLRQTSALLRAPTPRARGLWPRRHGHRPRPPRSNRRPPRLVRREPPDSRGGSRGARYAGNLPAVDDEPAAKPSRIPSLASRVRGLPCAICRACDRETVRIWMGSPRSEARAAGGETRPELPRPTRRDETADATVP